MPSAERIRDRGQRQARRVFQELGAELWDARLSAGLSQRHVASVAGLSQPVISRAEHVEDMPESLLRLALHCSGLGPRLSIKAYPQGSPVRDAGQLRLLARLRPKVHPRFRWRSEVPIGNNGDLRAWDAQLDGPASIGIDAETRLHDIQALQRRCETKWRDSGADRVVLLVARTRHDSAVLRDHREALRSTFPADSGAVLAALRHGTAPPSNGIIVL